MGEPLFIVLEEERSILCLTSIQQNTMVAAFWIGVYFLGIKNKKRFLRRLPLTEDFWQKL